MTLHTSRSHAHRAGSSRCLRLSRLAAIPILLTLAFVCAATIGAAPALALSEGRVYEMVTPVQKGGYGAVLTAVSPDGEHVAFDSLGVFAGVPRPEVGSFYVASRGTDGWVTTPIQPPFPESSVSDFSSTLEYALNSHAVREREGENGGVPDAVEFFTHRVGAPDTRESWVPFPGEIVLSPAEALWPSEEVAGSFVPSFVIAGEAGASSDLCHIIVQGGDLLPEAPYASKYTLYDLAGGCRGEGTWLHLVGVRNKNGPHQEPEEISKCATSVGLGTGYLGLNGEEPATFNAVSGDGSEIFFKAPTVFHGVECVDPQVFVRVGGERTVEVSRPVDPSLPFGGCGEGGGAGEVPGEVPCAGAASREPAFFKGASEDGSRVYFTTHERLLAGETDASNKLYLASIGCPEGESGCPASRRRVTGLVDVSRSVVAGEAAEVAGVVSVAGDGSRVYFVARGALTSVPDGEGNVARKGAFNLYVYDAATNSVSFIADLCSGAGLSGSVGDVRCPSSISGLEESGDAPLWQNGGGEAQSTGDGEFLVFSSWGRLVARGTQTDANNSQDVYRYDAQTGVLDRVSLGVAGFEANGNGEGDASIEKSGLGKGATIVKEHRLDVRAVSEDGSLVVFTSVRPLSAAATNGKRDIYLWHKLPGWREGRVSMISSGSSQTDDIDPVITPDGRDVFFTTSAGLVAADTEGDHDVYDARVEGDGGGFPEQPAQRAQCSSDACQGALTNPVPLLVPGSVAQAPGGNYPPVGAQPVKKPVKKRLVKRPRKVRGKGKAKPRAKRRVGR